MRRILRISDTSVSKQQLDVERVASLGLPCRRFRFCKAAFVFSAISLAVLVGHPSKADTKELMQDVLSICQNLKAEKKVIENSVLASGWIKEDTEPRQPSQAFLALMGVTMAHDLAYRTERSASRGRETSGKEALYSFILQNGPFIAASVLGNSALKRNQPSYTQESYGFSTMGLALDTPYCLLNGPSSLFDAFLANPDFQVLDDSRIPAVTLRPGAELYFGRIGALTAYVTRINIQQLISQATEAGVPVPDELVEALPPTSIQIMSPNPPSD